MNRAMSQREHAHYAEFLFDACGGLDEISRVFTAERRLRSKSVLSGYQNANDPSTMPAEVMDVLEAYCGKPIYSGAISARKQTVTHIGCLVGAACTFHEESGGVQIEVRQSMADGKLTPNEIDDIRKAKAEAEAALDTLNGLLRAVEAAGGKPSLQAVS